MRDQRIDITAIKQRISFLEVLDWFGLRNSFRQHGSTLRGVCPLPHHRSQSDTPRRDQLKITLDDAGPDLFFCFSCQRGGSIFDFVVFMTGGTHHTARQWFLDRFREQLSIRSSKEHSSTKLKPSPKAHGCQLPPIPELSPVTYNLPVVRSHGYLKQRRVPSLIADRFGIGYCSSTMIPSLRGYLVAPIFRWPKKSPDERPVVWLGRWPGEDYESFGKPRYMLGTRQFPKSKVIFGINEALALSSDRDPLILVEGLYDVLRLAANGFPNSVSPLSSSISPHQAAILSAVDRPLVIAFDGDQAGSRGTQIAIDKLAKHSFVRSVQLPPGKDPDDLNGDQLRALFHFAKPTT